MYEKNLTKEDQSLATVIRISKFLTLFFRLLAIVIVIILLIVITLGFIKQLRIVSFVNAIDSLFQLPILLSAGVAIATLLLGSSIFSDIAHSRKPFSFKQAHRIRIVAILFFIQAAVNTFLSPEALAVIQGDSYMLGYTASSAGIITIPIDAGSLVISLILFFASTAVKYATSLQVLSDETI